MKKLLTFLMVTGTIGANAQDSTEVKKTKFNISGYADAYYRYNFSDSLNNYTSFTNSHNSFELGMISVKAEQNIGKVGIVGDIGFGKRVEDFSYRDKNTMLDIKQLYISYAPLKQLKFSAGSWATHIGYESVDAPVNRNYSLSYMFSYGPFFHTGLKAEYTFGKYALMAGVVNPTDFKSASFAKKYFIGQASASLAQDKLKIYLNALAGKSSLTAKNDQFDLVINGVVSDKFSLGYNGTLASVQYKAGNTWTPSRSFWGSALYFNYDPMQTFGLTLRGEYFDDKEMITSVFSLPAQGGHVIEGTLSANFRVNSLTIIPEFRLEQSNKNVFFKSDGSAVKGTGSVLLAAVYKF